MTQYKSDFLRIAEQRGFIHQCTDPAALDSRLCESPTVAYVGYDCTADSLHVGNLISVMMMRWLQKSGHKPIALMGGGTTKVGDPSGKDETRKILSDADIAANMKTIRGTFERLLNFGPGETDAIMVNNADWLDGLQYISFLRDYGRHFSVNRMLTFDSVKLRLDRDQPLTFLEFNYMILQAYDFVELHRNYGCVLQMGGSDQWGNIVNGVELARRVGAANDQATPALFGLTCPLITTASGQKMGKTAAGAVWLSEHRLPVYDYWQFWRNTEDADVGRFMRLFTDMELDEIGRIEALEGSEINEAKKRLATEATALLHGRAAAETAEATARDTFERGKAAEGLPTVEIAAARLADGVPAFELLVYAGLSVSNGEARRLIKGGGARLNDAQIASEVEIVTTDAATVDGVIKLSAGKKRHVLLRPV